MAQKKKLISPLSRKIAFKNQLSNTFKNVKCDGAWGGITPRSEIEMVVYTERLMMPESVEFEIFSNGETGKETTNNQRRYFMARDAECSITMSLPVAQSLLIWLQDKVKTLESSIEQTVEENSEHVNLEVDENLSN